MPRRPQLALVLLLATACGKKEAPATTTPVDEGPGNGDLAIAVDDPEPATYHPTGAIEVQGNYSGLTNLTLDGEPIDVVELDTFSHTVELDRGVNTFEVRGEKGSTFRMVRQSVLAGSFAEASGPIEESVGIRVNRGGLDALGGLVSGLLDDASLSKSLAGANPVYESLLADVDIGALYFDPVQLGLEPTPDNLQVDVALPNAEVWLIVDVPLLGDFDAWAYMDAARITGDVQLGTDGQGHLTASLTNPTVSLENFSYDTSLLPGDTLALFDGTIQGVLEDVILEQIELLVPGLIEDQLSTLDLAFDLDLLGTPVSIGTDFAHAGVDADGVQIVADLDVDVDANGTKLAPGYLTADAAQPTPNTRDDLTVALSDDLVNRLLFEVWSGGILDLTLTTEDGTLPSSYLEDFGTEEGELTIDSQLPPVLVQEGDETRLEVGELLLHLSTPTNTNFTYIDLALSLSMPVDLEVVDGELDISLGTPELAFVVRDTDWGNVNEEWLTNLLEEELPIESLILVLGSFSFELPSIAGITLDNAAINRDDSKVFTNIAADL